MRWPPFGLELNTPANLALLSPEQRPRFTRTAIAALATGVAAALPVLGLDQLLFSGVSLQRVRAVDQHALSDRVLIVLTSGITEKIIYRLGIATAVAALVFAGTRRVLANAADVSMWTGVALACVLFGLAHVGNLPNVPQPYLRAITLNGVAGLVLGWLYWFRGLEAAVLAHLAADATIYLGVARLI